MLYFLRSASDSKQHVPIHIIYYIKYYDDAAAAARK